jgi:beta-glucosidase
MNFPKDFMWGAATASYQIEGAALEDGRGECIWTRFSHTPGKVVNGETGDVACDHYHRYRDDVKLMSAMGLKTYRFSISWPRVIPQGTGASNAAGLEFYDRLVDALLEADIVPCATLYHWDLPQALQDRGGWENPDSVGWFVDYADLMSRRLGDRVKNWITHNEPWVVAFVGNYEGRHAPGIKDIAVAYRVAHHLLLSHGDAVPVIRQNVPDAKVGITLNLNVSDPATDKPEDIKAAERYSSFLNRWFLDPVMKGHYPQDIISYMGSRMPALDFDAVKRAAVPTDFLGVNYYIRKLVVYDANDPLIQVGYVQNEGAEYTKMNWEVYPDGLTRLLIRINKDYAPKAIWVTENGVAFDDPQPTNGIVEDDRRVAYYEGYVKAVAQAIAEGVPVKAYYAWSFMDNFEWAFGYQMRFGLVHVDYDTLVRTPKRSGLNYRKLFASAETSRV